MKLDIREKIISLQVVRAFEEEVQMWIIERRSEVKQRNGEGSK